MKAVPLTIRSWSGGELAITWMLLYMGTFQAINQMDDGLIASLGGRLFIFVVVSIPWLAVTWFWMGRER